MIRQADDNDLDCLFFRLQRVFDDERFRSDVGDFECIQPSVTKIQSFLEERLSFKDTIPVAYVPYYLI